MSALTTSETLNLAADLIEERGWAYGGGWIADTNSKAPLCLEGGIQAALGIVSTGPELYTCSAYQAVQAFLGDRCVHPVTHMRSPHLWAYNDSDGRTVEEIVAVLRATAVIESARELRTTLAGLPGSEVPA